MQYLIFAMGAGAIVQLAASAYKRFERWNQRRRLRGAQECLDAVHNTLAGLAECNSYCQEKGVPNDSKARSTLAILKAQRSGNVSA
jgi:hypothetical protein